MKLYSCTTFQGFWPVGSAAVIVAENEMAAVEELTKALNAIGLPQTKDLVLQEIELSQAKAVILCDGDY